MKDDSLNSEHRKSIVAKQRDAFKRKGYHPNALLWSSTDVQEIRFQKITEIGIQAGQSVLDIGCGFGDFSDYLKRQEKQCDYTGIDISEELISAGQQRYPEITLAVSDLFEYDPKPKSVDFVTLSGTLNYKNEDSETYALRIIERMYQSCKLGVAFNCLDARHQWTAGRWDLQSFLPDEIIAFTSDFADSCEIIDGYLENDFSVYLKRK